MNVLNKRIAFVVNHAAFFVSHRLQIALSAMQEGYSVKLFIGQAASDIMESQAIKILDNAGIPYQRLFFYSDGVNPFVEVLSIIDLILSIRQYNPDIIHCVSPKGVLYGGFVARILGTKSVVLAISGMGYAFTEAQDHSWLRFLIRQAYLIAMKIPLSSPNLRLIVQNNEDYNWITETKLIKKNQVVIIKGSGVNLSDYAGCSALEKEQIVLFPARIIRDKGVIEFLQAANYLGNTQKNWRFILAGACDYKNPSALSQSDLDSWKANNSIEFLGHVDCMNEWYRRAAIVCLPSYREGMPKALLEAAAAGCAIITTDVTGCREAIIDGHTGELVPPRNTEALYESISNLINDEVRRVSYGINGQIRANREFSLAIVVALTLDIYKDLFQIEKS